MATANRAPVEVTARELQPDDRDMVGRMVVGEPRVLPSGRVEVPMRWPGTGKKETLRLDGRKAFRVMRNMIGPGKPLRHRATARATGGLVEVYDTHHMESPITRIEADGHRWAMRCEHGTIAGRRTYDDAQDDVINPRAWCGRCADEVVPGALLLPL